MHSDHIPSLTGTLTRHPLALFAGLLVFLPLCSCKLLTVSSCLGFLTLKTPGLADLLAIRSLTVLCKKECEDRAVILICFSFAHALVPVPCLSTMQCSCDDFVGVELTQQSANPHVPPTLFITLTLLTHHIPALTCSSGDHAPESAVALRTCLCPCAISGQATFTSGPVKGKAWLLIILISGPHWAYISSLEFSWSG